MVISYVLIKNIFDNLERRSYFSLFEGDENGRAIPTDPDKIIMGNDVKDIARQCRKNDIRLLDGVRITTIPFLSTKIGWNYVQSPVSAVEMKDFRREYSRLSYLSEANF
jgi:hypothetical protein